MGGAGKRMSIAGTAMRADDKSNSLAMALTDKEIDERVCFRCSSRYFTMILIAGRVGRRSQSRGG